MTRVSRVTLMPLAAAALCAAVVGCADQGRPGSTARVKDPRSMKLAELNSFVSTNAAIAAADAGAALTQLPSEPIPPPAPAAPPVPASPKSAPPARTVAITTSLSVPEPSRRVTNPAVKIDKVTSDKYYATEHDARYDALGEAVKKIAQKLSEFNPPIEAPVSRNRVWNEYVVPSTAKVVPLTDLEREALAGDERIRENSIRFEFDVELSERQVRDLRGEGRAKNLAPFALVGLGLCLGASVLLRLTGAAAAAVRRG